MGSKSFIRKSSFIYRSTLTHDIIQYKSALVVSKIASLISPQSGTILSYLPLLARSEIDLHQLERLLPASTFSYVEPKSNAPEPTGSFTHIIVPCVTADIQGYRLGYGQGWYDKFLLQHPDAITIGVCYEQCIVQKLPNEPHDVRLNYVISEERIIRPSVE